MTYHHHPKPFLFLLVSIWLRVWCLLSSSSYLQSVSSHPFKTDGTVIELDESNFDLAISTFDFILVDFYATWCGHCQRLSPELDVAAPVLAGLSPPMIIAKIDADKYRKLATKYEIDGFPTLKVFMHGVPIEYNGPRKADLLVQFLRKFVTPDVTILESDSAIHNFVKTSGTDFPIFIGFGLDESVIAEFAKKYKKKAWFSVAKDFSEDFMVTYDFDKVPALVSLHPSYNEQSVFYGPFEGHFLEEFIKQNQLPLSVPINYETLKLLSDDKRKIALTIMEDQLDEKSISLVKILKSAASANRDLVFSYVGVKQWKEFADTFEVNKGTKLPKMIIWDGNENYNIVEGSESLNDDEDHGSQISRILESYREGKVVQKRVGGPSFSGFINSLITINTLYLIIFVVAVLVLIQFMSRQGDIPQRSQARVSDTETSSSIHESERSEYRPEDKMD